MGTTGPLVHRCSTHETSCACSLSRIFSCSHNKTLNAHTAPERDTLGGRHALSHSVHGHDARPSYLESAGGGEGGSLRKRGWASGESATRNARAKKEGMWKIIGTIHGTPSVRSYLCPQAETAALREAARTKTSRDHSDCSSKGMCVFYTADKEETKIRLSSALIMTRSELLCVLRMDLPWGGEMAEENI